MLRPRTCRCRKEKPPLDEEAAKTDPLNSNMASLPNKDAVAVICFPIFGWRVDALRHACYDSMASLAEESPLASLASLVGV